MHRARSIGILALTLGACVHGGGSLDLAAPLLAVQPGSLRPTDLALPLHEAPIVDLAFVDHQHPARWRLMSADQSGWVMVWQDGRLHSASLAHHGGVSALVVGADGVPFSAGNDGRVLEWSRDGERIERVFTVQEPPVETKSKLPQPPVSAARAIIAMAVARDRLAITDGHWVQVWSREPTPRLIWSHQSRSFVTGLAMSREGSAIAIALLRQEALRTGVADHPRAEFPQRQVGRRDEARALEQADQEATIRMQARVDRPGATADLVEVHGLGSDWAVTLEPQAPIDADMAMPEEGLLVYREVYTPDWTRVIGRSVGDRIHVGVRVGVIATAPAPDDLEPFEDPAEGLADFAFGRGDSLTEPPVGLRLDYYDSLPVGARRELTLGNAYWAAGDEHGQIVIGPRGGGNLEVIAGPEPLQLFAAAAHQPFMVTTGLEHPIQLRRWNLAEGSQRVVGVLLAPKPDPDTGAIAPALFPVELAIDDAGNRIAVSSWSFSAEQFGDVRLFDLGAGSSTLIEQVASPSGLAIALAAEGDSLWSWHPGSGAREFAAPSWGLKAGPGSGRPLIAGDWLALVGLDDRRIVTRSGSGPVQHQTLTTPMSSEFASALASDGTLAVVAPLGGGTIERLHPTEGVLAPITTFGPVTALAWIANPDGPDSLLIGQAEGSIEVLDPGADEPRPLRPPEGGRVWALAAVGGSSGAFIELDDGGLSLHRVRDGASLSLDLANPDPMKDAATNPTPASRGLIVVWRPSAGMRPCRVFDGTLAGVVAAEGIVVERDEPRMLREFLAGEIGCEVKLEPAPIEPVPG